MDTRVEILSMTSRNEFNELRIIRQLLFFLDVFSKEVGGRKISWDDSALHI